MQSLKTEKLYIAVFKEIKRYILDNNLSPGDKLPTEFEMCEMLGVSRNVLREAIKALEIMGVVRSTPSKGIVVCEFSMDYLYNNMFYFLVSDSEERIREIMEIRKLLELGYMHLAFEKISDRSIKRLREIVDIMVQKAKAGEFYPDEDEEFHMVLFEDLENSTLNSLLHSAWEVDSELNIPERKKNLNVFTNKHVAIVEALENKDFEAFDESMRFHFASDTFVNTKNPTLNLYAFKLAESYSKR